MKLTWAKLQSIKDYIGFPKEIFNDTLIEDLYDGIEVSNDTFYQNSINMGKWSVKYAWSKLREKIDKTDWKRHANPAVVNAYYSGIENSIQFPAGILQVYSALQTKWFKPCFMKQNANFHKAVAQAKIIITP